MNRRRELIRINVKKKYAKKIDAIKHQETIVEIDKNHEFWNKSRLALMTLMVAAFTWIASESSRLVIDRNIPHEKKTSFTLGLIVLIIIIIIMASHFAVGTAVNQQK